MSHKKAGSTRFNGRSTHRIHLEIDHPTATAVFVAGTFNDWRPGATPMVLLGEGRWIKELVLLAGTYEYRFVLDGQWMCDPLAKGSAPNPFGGMNSVLRVPQDAPAAVPHGIRPAIPVDKQIERFAIGIGA